MDAADEVRASPGRARPSQLIHVLRRRDMLLRPEGMMLGTALPRQLLLAGVMLLAVAAVGRPQAPERPERDPRPPASLEQALDRLDKTLESKTIKQIQEASEADMGKYHFGLGLWMRNYWGLWDQGPLYQALAKLGLRHPDDMSGLILTCYWRRLHHRPLRVEDEVKRYQEYWRVTVDPPPGSNRACSADIKITLAFSPDAQDERLRGVHMGACCADGQVWSYHVGRGWYEPTAAELTAWQAPDGRWDACQH